MSLAAHWANASDQAQKAMEEKMTDPFEQHHNVHDIYAEAASLERRIKKDQSSIKNKPPDGNVVTMQSDKAKLGKVIALCRAEINDLNTRLDVLEKATSGSTR